MEDRPWVKFIDMEEFYITISSDEENETDDNCIDRNIEKQQPFSVDTDSDSLPDVELSCMQL